MKNLKIFIGLHQWFLILISTLSQSCLYSEPIRPVFRHFCRIFIPNEVIHVVRPSRLSFTSLFLLFWEISWKYLCPTCHKGIGTTSLYYFNPYYVLRLVDIDILGQYLVLEFTGYYGKSTAIQNCNFMFLFIFQYVFEKLEFVSTQRYFVCISFIISGQDIQLYNLNCSTLRNVKIIQHCTFFKIDS